MTNRRWRDGMKPPVMLVRSLIGMLFVSMLLVACGNDQDIRTRIDGDWHRQTLDKDHLEHWLKVLPSLNGFFNTAVSRDWQVVDPQPGDIVGQTRGIYLMVAGHELSGKQAYLEQVRQRTGLDHDDDGAMAAGKTKLNHSSFNIENSSAITEFSIIMAPWIAPTS